MAELFLDIETYSRLDIRKTSVYRYAEEKDFQILMCAWAVDDGPVQVAIGAEEIDLIPGLWDNSVLKIAHNAQFERICFSEFGRRIQEVERGEYLPPELWHDTAAVAAELGYPQKLEHLAPALGAEEKDSAGTRLINIFCKPNRKGERTLPEEKPKEWADFVEYCRQDVVTLRDVHRKLGGFPTHTEKRIFMADQYINDTGMAVDTEMAQEAMEAAEENRMLQELEISTITGVANPGSLKQLTAWLEESGLKVPNLKAETVTRLLKKDLTPEQRRVLELRQELALVASKKYETAVGDVCRDGRLRGGFRFFGAHTGRWTGRGVQPHNLPREQLETEADTDAAILDLKLGTGASSHALKALVRALFVGPFTVVDYSAIEARVISWLADEQWALDAFRNGRDIYVETAERMGGLTRRQGKVAVLALGYNGGTRSLEAMGAEGNTATLQMMVNQWRRANPQIVNFWREMSDSFKNGGPVGNRIYIETDGDDRAMTLPSGRSVVYRKCKWTWVNKTWPDGTTSRVLQASFVDPRKPQLRVDTYGGKLSENATQAVARDVMAESLVRLRENGYTVVGHVHDEILVEGDHSVSNVARIMTETPDWAEGLPIGAEGFTCRRYRKG